MSVSLLPAPRKKLAQPSSPTDLPVGLDTEPAQCMGEPEVASVEPDLH